MLIPLKTLLTKYNIQPTGILHIGASSGQEAKDYHNAGIKNVIWIEAIPYVFQQLLRTIELYPRNIAFNECIGDEDGKEMVFHISNNEAQSSSLLEFEHHKIDHPTVQFVQDIKVKTKRIDTLMNSNGLPFSNYDFINIDLQGAELMALKGFGEELHRVNYAYLEINKKHEYKDCPLVEDIDNYMWLFGFERVETEWCGNFSWGDGFYVKKELL